MHRNILSAPVCALYTCIAPHALIYFTKTPLDVMPELAAGPGQMWVDICLWVVPLEMPQFH